ncbi:MAG: hypothetical protein JJU31_08045 [Wenzhouxiangella sp.]|nr:hypothetical protein [Wenzhouxiangella sp.]
MTATTRLLFAGLVLALTGSATAIINPNFAPEQSYAGAGDGSEVAGPDGWTLRDLPGRALVSTVDFAVSGERVFWFETLTGGFGDNKLDQCVALSDSDAFAFSVLAWTATPDSDLRVRLNAEYYSSEADCLARSNRLGDDEEDFRLDGDPATWTSFTLIGDAPPATTHVRISLRARDRTGAGNNPATEPKFIYVDALDVAGGDLLNGDFSATSISLASFAQDQGPFGWSLRSVSDSGLVVPEPTAELGSAFRFSELGTGYGNNTLEQCVDISQLDPFVFDASVWPNLADVDLRVRLALNFFATQNDCISRQNDLGDPVFDFRTSDMVPESWNALRSGLIIAPAAASWGRIALRARDQRPAGADPVILFDRIALTDRFFVGGSVSGLAAGAELSLDNNGELLLITANGGFVFGNALAHDAAYAVTITQQPTSPSQTCMVSSGSGQIDADDVTDVLVECATDSFTIGGSVAGLETGNSVVLQLNGDSTVTVSANEPFSFTQALLDGSAYAVTVLENPSSPDQTCTVANGEGVLSGSNVDDVLVTCATDSFTIGGSLSNLLAGTTVVLQNNGADDLSLDGNGVFTFSQAVADGSAYAVTVLSQPSTPNQVCAVSNGSGVIAGADVDDVLVSCEIATYPVAGTLSGLADGASLSVQINGDETLALNSNGSFQFPTALADGSSYTVLVISQPTAAGQICSISNGSGIVSGAAVDNIQIICVADSFLLGGFLSGLAAGNSLTLVESDGQSLILDANGAFVFPQLLADGSSYQVSVTQQPTSPAQVCSVVNGSGNIAGADVTNLSVECQADSTMPGTGPGGLGAGMAIINPNFGLEQAYAGSGAEFAGPDGWILRDLEDRRGLVSSFELAPSGSRVFRFESPQRGFGDNKLEQCLPVTDPAAFALRLQAWSSLSDPEVQVRVNIESYASAADCSARSNRIDNSDFDFPLTAPAQSWQALALAQALDPAASHARISIRMRDRSAGGDPAEPPVTVLFDSISAIGAALANGDFEVGSLAGAMFGLDQGPLGWTLRSVIETGLVLAEPSASGGSAFQFTRLGEGFGDNTLEQCVPIDLNRFVLSASVWPELRNPDLRIRLNVDLHANLADCLARSNRLDRRDTDFRTSGLNPGTWNTISTDPIARPSGATYARIALRARDRIEPPPASPPIILFDQVRLTADAVAVPVNHPLALLLLLALMLGLGGRLLTSPHRRA